MDKSFSISFCFLTIYTICKYFIPIICKSIYRRKHSSSNINSKAKTDRNVSNNYDSTVHDVTSIAVDIVNHSSDQNVKVDGEESVVEMIPLEEAKLKNIQRKSNEMIKSYIPKKNLESIELNVTKKKLRIQNPLNIKTKKKNPLNITVANRNTWSNNDNVE